MKTKLIMAFSALSMIIAGCCKEYIEPNNTESATSSPGSEQKVVFNSINASSTTVAAGESITLTAEATGEDLIYRWFDSKGNCIGNSSAITLHNGNTPSNCGGMGGGCGSGNSSSSDMCNVTCIVMNSTACSSNSSCTQVISCTPCPSCCTGTTCTMINGCANNNCSSNGCSAASSCGSGGNCGGAGNCGTCVSTTCLTNLCDPSNQSCAGRSVQITFLR
jgi:hypothetical protein